MSRHETSLKTGSLPGNAENYILKPEPFSKVQQRLRISETTCLCRGDRGQMDLLPSGLPRPLTSSDIYGIKAQAEVTARKAHVRD